MKIDLKTYNSFIYQNKNYNDYLNRINKDNDMMGWVNSIDQDTINQIKNISKSIINNADILLVIGIGGSYLGAKAIIDLYSNYFEVNKPEIIFIGNNLSETYLTDLFSYINNKSVYVNVISKSGTTLETNIVFERIYDYLNKHYNETEVKERLIITTDAKEGELRTLAEELKCNSLTIPSNVGGRFSALTAVGLLPIAVANINIDHLITGYNEGHQLMKEAFEFALARHEQYQNHKYIEAIVYYEPKLHSIALWYQQLFAESQGKNKQGILPICVENPRDLHSLGQYFQEGTPIFFETVFLPPNNQGLDYYNYITATSVAKTHYQNNSSSFLIDINFQDEREVGQFIYFCYLTATFGAFLMNVNPFDQPGVEQYKKTIKNHINN